MELKNDGTHKQVIVMRADLKMPKGKMVAQGAHASLGAVLDFGLDDPRIAPWIQSRFTKVCLKVESEAELLELERVAKEAGLITKLIKDAGFTVFNEPTITCLAIGPDTIERVNSVTLNLKLL